jgi:hypothetical protein
MIRLTPVWWLDTAQRSLGPGFPLSLKWTLSTVIKLSLQVHLRTFSIMTLSIILSKLIHSIITLSIDCHYVQFCHAESPGNAALYFDVLSYIFLYWKKFSPYFNWRQVIWLICISSIAKKKIQLTCLNLPTLHAGGHISKLLSVHPTKLALFCPNNQPSLKKNILNWK